MNLFSLMTDPAPFMPHGMCLLWEPALIWLHVASDVLTGLAYFSIPVALIVFARRRKDLAYKWMFLLFGAFIFACGTTHFMGAWTLWHANYVAEGLVKGFTAAVSLVTAALLWPLIPKALALPSPSALREANAALAAQVAERERAEQAVRAANDQLTQALRALRASEARYAGMVNNAPDAIFVLDVEPDGNLLLSGANPVTLRELDRPEAELLGRRVEDVFSPMAAGALVAHARACVAGRAPVRYEVSLEGKAGRRVWQVLLSPVADPETGSVVQVVGSSRDLTDYRTLQEELAQASKLATLGTMAAGIAHEMSQPLNAIRITATDLALLLEEEGEATDVPYLRHGLTTIRDQSARMGGIVDQMRQFGRKDGTEAELFDPAEPFRRAAELVGRHFASIDIRLVADLPQDLPKVAGRSAKLEQVALNLLSNARDAIEERRRQAGDRAPGRILVEAGVDGVRNAVVLTVEDDGTGLSPAALEHLFDPFFTTKDTDKGMGLGLSISASIIGAMGGRIEATPQPGGARFTITLPIQPVRQVGASEAVA
ncbi:PAS domain-containing protein [Aerophototrophica crusticola]|uniref:histidine kinase n=1 Tax=Aerophototrophica crusticola TaxID=1709002 RepID=A0A858R935_9PROT|nr:PAS domain-containing protein [Rhodospirillaceae bacterium B3]